MKIQIEQEGSVSELREFFCRLFRCCPKVRMDFAIGLVTTKTTNEKGPMDISLTNEQQVRVTLKPVTATGKPATLDGKPVWAVDAGSSTIDVAPDGLSAVVISSDDPGDSVVSVAADADLGEGVETIAAAINVTVIGARASNLGMVIGKPEPKPGFEPPTALK